MPPVGVGVGVGRRRQTRRGAALIPLGGRIVFLGDSITAGSAGRTLRHWTIALLNGRLYPGPGANLGIGGERMDQMRARLDQATRQRPAVLSFNGGTNDLSAGRSLAAMQADHQAIVDAVAAVGARVVRLTIPRSTATTGSAETKRQEFNAWLAGRGDIALADVETAFDPADPSLCYDGTHPTAKGSRVMAEAIASAIAPSLAPGSILFADAAAAAAAGNLESDWSFAGIAGALGAGGPTGEVATGWTLAHATGAAVVAAKTTLDGALAQRIDVTGSASSNTVRLTNTTSAPIATGDYLSSWVDVSITATDGVSAPVGLAGFHLLIGSLGSAFTTAPDAVSGPIAFPVRGVVRTAGMGFSGSGASIGCEFGLRTAAGSVDIRATVARFGVVRAELDPYGEPTRITTASPPAVTGAATVGQTLTASVGTWAGGAIAYAFQWLRSGAPIVGATSRSYVAQAADRDATLACAVTASNAHGAAAATTAPTSSVT